MLPGRPARQCKLKSWQSSLQSAITKTREGSKRMTTLDLLVVATEAAPEKSQVPPLQLVLLGHKILS